MAYRIDDDLVNGIDGPGKPSGMVRLIEFGRRKSYVTIDDILRFFPDAENDGDQLEEAFVALLSAGIPYREDTPSGDPTEAEFIVVEENIQPPSIAGDDNYLDNIEAGDSLGLYLREAARVPLLSLDEEVQLARRIELGQLAREEFAQGKASSRRRQELQALIEDSGAAREHLITANSRLVISVAKKYRGRGVPFLDLIQEGNIGLMRAVKKFDYRLGYKFSTYATWWVRQAVTRALCEQGRTIRLPVHMSELVGQMLRAQYQLAQKLGREPSLDELAEALATTPLRVQSLIQVSRQPLSLETPVSDDVDVVLGDFIQDENLPEMDESTIDDQLREYLELAMSDLRPREAHILQLRYGLVDGRTYTLEEVGRKLGVTRERVRQMEAHALSHLRHPATRSRLRDFLG